MKRFGFVLLLSVMLAACSDEESLGSQEVQANQGEVTVIKQVGKLYFPDGHGDVQFIFDRDAVNIQVFAEKLSSAQTYIIMLEKADGGVTFGPEENVKITAGEIVGKTAFKPNANGELFVSMRNPNRLFEGKEEMRVIIQSEKDAEDSFQSEPFTLQTRE
ncbi:MAG: hypothetical protein ACI33P_05495 [Lysinibacillus sp.]